MERSKLVLSELKRRSETFISEYSPALGRERGRDGWRSLLSLGNVKPTLLIAKEKVVLKHPVDEGKSEERFPIKSSPHSLSRHCRLSNGARAPDDGNVDRFKIDYKRFQIQGVRGRWRLKNPSQLKMKKPPQRINSNFHLHSHCFKSVHLVSDVCSSHLRFHQYTIDALGLNLLPPSLPFSLLGAAVASLAPGK